MSLFFTEIFSIITFYHKDYSLCFLKALGSTQSKSGARPPVRAATSLAVSPWLFLRLGSRSACERSNSTVSREFEARQARWSGVWPPLVTQLTGVLDSKSSATRTQFHLEAECKGVQPSIILLGFETPVFWMIYLFSEEWPDSAVKWRGDHWYFLLIGRIT